MKKRIAFRVEFYHEIGLGHLSRCITIANQCIKQNIDVIFLTNPLTQKVKKSLSLFTHIELTSSEIDSKYLENISLFVIDLSHNLYLTNPPSIDVLIKSLRYINIPTLLIDGLHKECILNKLVEVPDFALFPYYSIEGYSLAKKETLLGAQYAILPEEFSLSHKVELKEIAKNILVTFGGSDPFQFSLQIVPLLLTCIPKFNITLIIGTGFKPELVKELNELSLNNARLNIITNTNNLYDYFANADIAIISTGLTKYEAAALGVPSIHISITQSLRDINKDFSEHLNLCDFGPNISTIKLKNFIVELAQNKQDRLSISNKSLALVDGNGCLRVIDKIKEWIV